MLYFAYGSNMDMEQMRERCPSARFVGIATLRSYRLAFTRKSRKRQCGAADVLSDKSRVVWGAVFEIDDREIVRLDRSEGHVLGRRENAYNREQRQVFLDDKDDQQLAAMIYIAEREMNPPPPNMEYKSQILAAARDWGLPSEYIRELEAIEATP